MHASHPQSVCDRARKLAQVHNLRTVAAILHVNPSAVYRMRDRAWKATRRGKQFRPVPSDFAIQAQHMSTRQMAEHYHASQVTVCRWLKENPVRPHWKPGKKARAG